jgi:hypothetical protein
MWSIYTSSSVVLILSSWYSFVELVIVMYGSDGLCIEVARVRVKRYCLECLFSLLAGELSFLFGVEFWHGGMLAMCL